MEFSSISKLAAFSALILIFVRWILYGGYFNTRIHKYDRKINIATKIMENEKLSNKTDINIICSEIIKSSLFGIEYICDCNGKQLLTLEKMIENGLTKYGVKVASRMIDKTNGRLHGPGLLKYIFGIVLFFSSILFFFISYLTVGDILGYNNFYRSYNLIQVAANISIFSFSIYQYLLIMLERRISIMYDSDGQPTGEKTTFFKTYIWWWSRRR